jgi:AcrR family transcriptional regulator
MNIMPKETFTNLPEEKQEQIMRTSINEFYNYGFEKGNVGNIAKKAGVAKGSMYQYFDNKKELFLYSVKWAMELLVKKFYKEIIPNEEGSIFDFFYQNAKDIMFQMRGERELVIFMQDVFLGKYQSLTGESMSYVNQYAEEYILKLISIGKKNGTIRTDIDDHILILFITGVSFKIKEYIMNKARSTGEDIIDEDYEVYEKDIISLIDLLKNGMGGK